MAIDGGFELIVNGGESWKLMLPDNSKFEKERWKPSEWFVVPSVGSVNGIAP